MGFFGKLIVIIAIIVLLIAIWKPSALVSSVEKTKEFLKANAPILENTLSNQSTNNTGGVTNASG